MERSSPTATTERLASWYDAYARDVYAYVARRLGPDIASDVTHETFKIALENPDAFDPRKGQPRPWLFGIATKLIHRAWRDERRKRTAIARLATAVLDSDGGSVDHESRLDAIATVDAIGSTFAELSTDELDVLTLIAWEGMTNREVALVLNIPAGTVRSRLHRARSVLIRAIAAATNEEDSDV